MGPANVEVNQGQHALVLTRAQRTPRRVSCPMVFHEGSKTGDEHLPPTRGKGRSGWRMGAEKNVSGLQSSALVSGAGTVSSGFPGSFAFRGAEDTLISPGTGLPGRGSRGRHDIPVQGVWETWNGCG